MTANHPLSKLPLRRLAAWRQREANYTAGFPAQEVLFVSCALSTGKEREVRRRGHKEHHGETQPEIDLHGDRGHASQLRRLRRHWGAVLGGSARPGDEPLLAA